MARYGAFAIALVVVSAFSLLAFEAWRAHGVGSVAYIDIEGQLGFLERQIVEQRLATIDREEPDIARVRSLLEALPWVDRVNVRRVWPGGLLVSVTRHRAIARWGSDAYLSDRGVVFTTVDDAEERLPRLAGPAGSEHRMMEQYQQLAAAFQRVGQTIEDVTLGDRGDWVLRLRGGVVVRLGKEDISDRLTRLMRVAEEARLLGRIGEIEEIDARYTNGVAVQWRDELCTNGCFDMAENDNLKRVHTL